MNKKKLLLVIVAAVLIVAVVVVALVVGSLNKKEAKYNVGVCQLVQHPALDQATKGFIDALKEEFGDDINIDVKIAQGDSNMCTTFVNEFKNANVDLVMANATAALNAAYKGIENIPILGTSVTEYGVALELENFNGVTGVNVSGTSDLAPLEQQAQMILDLMPNVKTVGILYCESEKNSEYQVAIVKSILEQNGVNVIEIKFTDTNDVKARLEGKIGECDAIYTPTDNVVALCAETIGSVIREANKPLFAGEENVAKVCGVASLTIDYYELGRITGQMAAKILKGEADVSQMPIEYATPTKKYNKEMCELLGIVIPEGYEEIK